jgi:hypothetical protein
MRRLRLLHELRELGARTIEQVTDGLDERLVERATLRDRGTDLVDPDEQLAADHGVEQAHARDRVLGGRLEPSGGEVLAEASALREAATPSRNASFAATSDWLPTRSFAPGISPEPTSSVTACFAAS